MNYPSISSSYSLNFEPYPVEFFDTTLKSHLTLAFKNSLRSKIGHPKSKYPQISLNQMQMLNDSWKHCNFTTIRRNDRINVLIFETDIFNFRKITESCFDFLDLTTTTSSSKRPSTLDAESQRGPEFLHVKSQCYFQKLPLFNSWPLGFGCFLIKKYTNSEKLQKK